MYTPVLSRNGKRVPFSPKSDPPAGLNLPEEETVLPISTAALFFFATPAYAEDIVVTARRVAEDGFHKTASVSVFDERAILSSGAQNLLELIEEVPGIGIWMNGTFGKSTSLSLRGTDNRHALILIDGVPMGDATSIDGAARPEFLSLQDVAEVKIFKGSQGVPYGSGAVGGVIAITTKRGGAKPSTSFKVGYGSFDNKMVGAGFSGRTNRLSYALSGSHQNVGGISSYPSYRDPHADADSYANSTFSANLGYSLRPKRDISASLRSIRAHYLYDGYGSDDDDNRARYISHLSTLRYRDMRGEWFNPEIVYAASDTDRILHEEAGSSYSYKGRKTSLAVSNRSFYGPQSSVTLGFREERETAEALGATEGKRKADPLRSLYAHHYTSYGRLFSDQGLRFDRSRSFGSKPTYRLGFGIETSPATFKTSYSSALKAPSLFTTHGPFGGNRDLKPEYSRSFELGASGRLAFVETELVYFRIGYTDFIDYIGNRYANAGDFRTSGLEWTLRKALSRSVSLQSHATLLKAVDKKTGHPLPHRPRRRGGFGLKYRPKDLYQVDIKASFVGSRPSIDGIELPRYHTLALGGYYRLGGNQRIQLRVENLTNKRYEEVAGYATTGRNIEVHYSIEI